MKEYTPPSLLACEHVNEDGEQIPCPGMCPKLVIKSWAPPGFPDLGPESLHAVAFSASEVRTLVREADRGYFDLPDMPPRKDSRFWDPMTAMLMESLQTNPVRALGILLFLGQPEAIAFTNEPEPILALQDMEGEWMWIHLNGKAPEPVAPEPADVLVDDGSPQEPDREPTEAEQYMAEFDDTDDDEDIAVPQAVTAYNDHPPAGATMLWTRPTPEPLNEEDRYDVTNDGNAALDA